MKDRVRQAVFNLIGPAVAGKHVLDLFAGTGALGLEALSRGAAGATFIEKHFPTADLVRKNVAELGVQSQCQVVAADTFLWCRKLPALPLMPWLVFISPPYDLYVEWTDEMIGLVSGLLEQAPPDSLFVVEADQRFDLARLPDPNKWDIRRYPPAIVGILQTAG